MLIKKETYNNLVNSNAMLESKVSNLENQMSYMTTETDLFDGEKTAGELGTPKIIYPDYYSARERAWELQLTNSTAKLIVNKWAIWAIGNGLRFNATPSVDIQSPTFDRSKFIKDVEFRFRAYCNSRYCDHASMINFHEIEKEVYYNTKTAGDVLVILRVVDSRITVQVVDGANVCSPLTYDTKNQIIDGVEIDKNGKHIAYHVFTDEGKFARIKAENKFGIKTAFLVYNSKFRLNETRGVPELLESFEKLKSIDRYIDATVKNAELTSEMVFVNEHDNTSTGEDVLKNQFAQKMIAQQKSTPGEPDIKAVNKKFINNLAQSTKGTALNNTIGAKLKQLKPDAETMMPDFVDTNLKLVSSSSLQPYEVTMSAYSSNYTAARGAIKDWDYNLKVDVHNFSTQFNQNFYELWLFNEVLLGNVVCPDLLKAYSNKDYVMISSLTKATFTGINVPSIDPLKEIKAVRETLGETYKNIPLSTFEQAADIISQKDFSEIQSQVEKELEIAVQPEPEIEPKENEL